MSVGSEINANSLLAVFIPTYNRAMVIKELLEKYLPIYIKFGIDLYIYDSSEDNDTQRVANHFQSDFNNLYYIRFPSDMHSNIKVYKIYQKYCWAKHYDYVWMCQDALRFSEEIITKVIDNSIIDEYDILVTFLESDDASEPVYSEIKDFFVRYAWKLTLYGSCVLRTRTMLEGVNWDYLIGKYCVPDKINFSHICFYFEQITGIKNFKAKDIHTNSSLVRVSGKKIIPGWYEDTFKIWLDYCSSAINALPDVYENKVSAIRNYGIKSTNFNLLKLRKDGLLNKEVYLKYKRKWAQYSGSPTVVLYLYTKLPISVVVVYDALRKLGLIQFISHLLKRRASLKRMRRFCKEHDKVYIYGAGMVAERYMEFLRKMRITLQGLIVTDTTQQNNEHIAGFPIIDLATLQDKDNAGIILGLNPDNANEVKQYLAEKKFSGGVFDEYIRK